MSVSSVLKRLDLAVGVEDSVKASSVLPEEFVIANRGLHFCCILPASRIVLEGSSAHL